MTFKVGDILTCSNWNVAQLVIDAVYISDNGDSPLYDCHYIHEKNPIYYKNQFLLDGLWKLVRHPKKKVFK